MASISLCVVFRVREERRATFCCGCCWLRSSYTDGVVFPGDGTVALSSFVALSVDGLDFDFAVDVAAIFVLLERLFG